MAVRSHNVAHIIPMLQINTIELHFAIFFPSKTFCCPLSKLMKRNMCAFFHSVRGQWQNPFLWRQAKTHGLRSSYTFNHINIQYGFVALYRAQRITIQLLIKLTCGIRIINIHLPRYRVDTLCGKIIRETEMNQPLRWINCPGKAKKDVPTHVYQCTSNVRPLPGHCCIFAQKFCFYANQLENFDITIITPKPIIPFVFHNFG